MQCGKVGHAAKLSSPDESAEPNAAVLDISAAVAQPKWWLQIFNRDAHRSRFLMDGGPQVPSVVWPAGSYDQRFGPWERQMDDAKYQHDPEYQRGIDDAEYQRGVHEAQDDIAKDTCRLFLQTRSFWGRRITDIMSEGYAVEVVHISDMTWESKWSFEAGYNSTIIAHLDAQYGIGTWDRIWNENQEFRLEVYRKWPPKTS